jgi:hypothetical protein
MTIDAVLGQLRFVNTSPEDEQLIKNIITDIYIRAPIAGAGMFDLLYGRG